MTPFFASSIEKNGPPWYQTVASNCQGYYLDGLPSENYGDLSSADARALTECYSRLSAQQTQFGGQQFLGELRETLKMFKKPFRDLNGLMTRYADQVSQYHHLLYNPKVSVLTKKRLLKTAGSSWLEVAFGLRPLMSDVKEAAEALARHQYDKRRVVVVGKAGSEMSKTVNKTTSFTAGNCRMESVITVEYTGSVMYRAYCDWTAYAAFGSAERLAELSGFRADLFIPTLYELVPWSWLADYWSNLGTVIETGCQSQNMVRFVVRSQKLETLRTVETYGVPNSTTFLVSFNSQPGKYAVRHMHFSRGSSTKLPSVPFLLEFPGKKTQWANMFAVIAARLKP